MRENRDPFQNSMPSQSLSLSQSQRLQMVLAPQLRQSLEMLQVPVLELRAMIQQELEQNPTLEDIPIEGATVEIEPESEPEGKIEDAEMDFDKEFEALANMDDEWRDYFYQDLDSQPYSPEAERKHQYLLDSLPQTESLQEHLLKQLRLSDLSDQDRQLGELIIGCIDEDGYLTSSPAELAQATPFDEEHLADILSIIQDFHPVGVGATDLRDCLLLQLERTGQADSLAGDIVRDQIDKLATHKYADLARLYKVSEAEIRNAASIIASLDPKPGHAFSADRPAYVLPEIIVKKIDGEYVIILNDDELPRLRISRHYRRLMSDEHTTQEVKLYIRDRIRASTFLIKSIDQRQRTIYRIAAEIVRIQEPFLDQGIAHLKPLTMAQVAEAVGVHETTVSRAVSGKYMRTPSGTFELKYFFTPGIKMRDGADISNKTVKDQIARLIADESTASPLSDQELVSQLKARGIKIARRTVAKYRIELRIPPSHQRRIG